MSQISGPDDWPRIEHVFGLPVWLWLVLCVIVVVAMFLYAFPRMRAEEERSGRALNAYLAARGWMKAPGMPAAALRVDEEFSGTDRPATWPRAYSGAHTF